MVQIQHHSTLPTSNPYHLFPPPPPEYSPIPPNRTVRLVIIGDVKVGKTSILRRFTQHRFISQNDGSSHRQQCPYNPTIGSDYTRVDLQLNDDLCIRLQLWDTSGAQKFEEITGQCLQQTRPDGIIIVCDNTHDMEDSTRRWYSFIANRVDVTINIPIILMVNKADELDESQASTGDILEMGKKIEQLCREFNLLAWFTTSAKNDINVSDGVHTLIQDVLKRRGIVFGLPSSDQIMTQRRPFESNQSNGLRSNQHSSVSSRPCILS